MNRRNHLVKKRLAALISGAFVFTVVHAQETPAPAAPPAPPAEAATPDAAPVATPAAPDAAPAATPAAPAAKIATIVVTGSRVLSPGNSSPTPLTAVSSEELGKLQPTTLTEQVNLLPALQGSQSTTSTPGGAQRNGAAAYFNLRNMGDLRTLVLVDGMRVVPTINQNQGNTDAAIIPQMLLKRVDVVTGGVSAVYGSDAISGVINFVTDNNFNGVKVQASKGVSTYHDDNTWDLGIAAGKKILDGRGHVEFSLQHRDDPGIFDKSTRPFFANNTGGAGLGTAASPYRNIPDQRVSNTSSNGLITNIAGNNTLKDLMFTPQGTLTPFIHGASTGVANVESGGSGGFFSTSSLKSALSFDQFFTRADYDITDDVKAFAQLSYSNIKTANNYQSPNISGIRISNSNPFLANVQAPYSTALAANPAGTFTFSRLLDNQPRAEQTTRSHTLAAGLSGTLFTDYTWNIGGQLAESELQASNLYNINTGRLYAAVDAVNVGGKTVCRASLTNAAYANCVPLNLFGAGNSSAAALDYIYQRTDNENRTRMETVNGSITGEPISTWAGPVRMAVSSEFRRLRWDVQSNGGPNDLANCTGIAYNCTATGNAATRTFFFNTQGSLPVVTQRVAEIAYEANVPLLRKLPFAKSLDVSGAARYTHYNTTGGVTTAKLGANWEVNDSVMFRATRSRDIRAPNLFELYAPVQINPGTALTDLHTGIQGVVPNQQTSNPDLKPEKAVTSTLGVVFTPTFAPGFSFSVDAFQIKVKDVIYLLAARSDQAQQQCEQSNGTSPICTLFTRPLPFSDRSAANFPTLTASSFLNIAELNTWGTDVDANYRSKLFGNQLTLRGLVSYQPQLRYDQGPLGIVDLGNAATGVNLFPAAPKLKVTLTGSYDVTEKFNVAVLQRWRGRMKVTALTTPVVADPWIPSLGYTTLNLSYKFKTQVGDAEAYLNVANLFNKFPTVNYPGPVNNPGLGLGIPAGDDPIGRYFTVGLRIKL